MAAITVTAIDFAADAETIKYQAGEAIALGDSIYRDTTSSNKWRPADANASALAAGQDGIAIALHAVSADLRWGVAVTRGTIYITTLGATALGTVFIVGAAAGDIAPDTDAASGWYITTLGTGGTEGTTDTSDEFVMDPVVSNRAKA